MKDGRYSTSYGERDLQPFHEESETTATGQESSTC